MKIQFLHFILIIIISTSTFSQPNLNDLPKIPDGFINQVYKLKPSLQKLQKINETESLHKQSGQDLVIGQTDPNEIITISGPYFLDGNLIIVNNGQLILDNADFKINGKITLLNNGKLTATGGSFKVTQEYIYQFGCLLLNKSEFHFDGVSFSSNGQSWGMTVTDSANYILENSEITDGFITTGMTGNGTALINNTSTPGEFVCMGSNILQVNNSDFVLMWLVLPDSSIVDVSLPDDSLLMGWQFQNGNPGVSGIPYTLSIDSCTNVLWGLISMSGSDGTFTNTDFRTSGLYFTEPDSIIVSNITNNSFYSDEIINVPDRDLRMINTQVATWNFYPALRSNITIENCIFGELLAFDTSNVLIQNSICDGTGGYLGAIGHSFLVIIGSLVSSQTIAREYGFLIGGFSAFNSPEIDADDNAVMAILGTSTLVEPEAHNAAVIFEEQMPPVEGYTESEVGIGGTARIITGPLSTIEFQGYSVRYAENFQNPVWQQTDGIHLNQVTDDTLTVWNTSGLQTGQYALLLTLFHSLGDSIPFGSSARLEQGTTNVSEEKNQFTFKLEQNYPNPFNPTTSLQYAVGSRQFVTLKVYDVLGTEVAILVNEELSAGKYEINFDGSELSSGIYFYQIKAGNFIQTRKMILIK
jgi:hypothetical protein